MDELQLLIDLHRGGERQGPGSPEVTLRAVALAGLAARKSGSKLRIADIGCGTGASALLLAEALDAQIEAVDFLPEFIEVLQHNAAAAGLEKRISTHVAAMDVLPFAPQSLDAIWSEGAIYNMGFTAGVRNWRSFLKPGGVLAVSELTWFDEERPAELTEYWEAIYPEVSTASEKLAILEQSGYSPRAYFALPGECWTTHYFDPLRERAADFLAAHNNSEAAQALVCEQEEEIALYERFGEHWGYGFYIAQRVD